MITKIFARDHGLYLHFELWGGWLNYEYNRGIDLLELEASCEFNDILADEILEVPLSSEHLVRIYVTN